MIDLLVGLGHRTIACVIAIGMLTALRGGGGPVPHDVSVVGHDDDTLSRLTCFDLTTVSQNTEEQARQAESWPSSNASTRAVTSHAGSSSFPPASFARSPRGHADRAERLPSAQTKHRTAEHVFASAPAQHIPGTAASWNSAGWWPKVVPVKPRLLSGVFGCVGDH